MLSRNPAGECLEWFIVSFTDRQFDVVYVLQIYVRSGSVNCNFLSCKELCLPGRHTAFFFRLGATDLYIATSAGEILVNNNVT